MKLSEKEIKRRFQAQFGTDPAIWREFQKYVRTVAEGKYKEPPVSVREFFSNKYYSGDTAGSLYEPVMQALEEVCSGRYVEGVMTGGIGVSKALALDVPLPTPTGWTTMGEVKAGDQVYDEQGKACTVLAAHPVRHGRPCYEVVFSDGAVIVADGDHNWWTQTRNERRQKKPGAVRTTSEIRASLKHVTALSECVNHSVPVAEAIEGSWRTLVIDPYILGLWLGDGGKEGTKFWTEDAEIAVAFSEHYEVRRFGKIDYAIKGLRADLHVYGLVNNKRIPAHYQRALAADRLALLQGLMDTDGTVQGNAKLASLTLAQEDLAEDAFELICGLGFKPTKTRVKTTCQTGAIGEAWVIRFSAYNDRPVFRLPRKVARMAAPPTVQKDRARRRYIVDVRPVPSVPVRCITVDSPNSLYLAGEHFVVTHNTTIALLGTFYTLYQLSLMWQPQTAFGLLPSDEIVFIFQSITEDLATNVDYKRFQEHIAGSQYFREHFPPNPRITSELQFPNHIYVRALTGADTAAIGQNVFGGILDEVNFMSVVKESKKAVDGGTFDQAQQLYQAIRRRRESRFMKLGSLPGLLFLVSSKRYPGEFTDVKMEEARLEKARYGETKIFIYDKKIWEVQPQKFGKERFRIFVGDEIRQPHIMEEGEQLDPEDAHLMLEVPEEYRMGFEMDILSALRDIGGASTMAIQPYIIDTRKVAAGFGVTTSILSQPACDFKTSSVEIFPKLFKNLGEPRFVHIDLAIRGDSAGVACGYIEKFVKVDRDGQFEILPVFTYDFILEVKPPKNGEIIFEKIRTLLYKARELGLPIKWVTLDSFQSRDTIQILRSKNFGAGLQSIDTTSQPYDVLKQGFLDSRVRAPQHERARLELVRLEQDARTGKVDHPANSSKDLSDAMAGVAIGLITRREIWAKHKVLNSIPAYLSKPKDLGEAA